MATQADFIDSDDQRNHATEEISSLLLVSGPATADDVQANASGNALLTLSKRLRIVVKPDGTAREAVTKPASEWLLCMGADRLTPPSFTVDRIAAKPPFTVACSSRHRDQRDRKIGNLITMSRSAAPIALDGVSSSA
ncbi:hypothetical protein [Burkholderia sp. WTPI3]|uniref:hypothetical protein n=1 Tax=Burkholderia sp. WTPI3 TaxID=2822167 RepID=UPI001F382FBE|nr:hypothetical protein [Burkholderia sp. WTPI3]